MTKKLSFFLLLLLLLATSVGAVAAQDLDFPYPFPTPGGTLEFNSIVLREEAGIDIAITVNLFDGTSTIWDVAANSLIPIYPQLGIYEFYAIIGRRLSVNPELTDTYATTTFAANGSNYDGEYGVLWDANSIPRTTYTPLMMAQLIGFQDVQNFGLIGGHTDIALMHRYYLDDHGQLAEATPNSHYTIHRVPQAPDQDVLLREPDLIRANDPNSPMRGPMAYPTLNRSSGCVNYDAATWIQLKSVIQPYLDQGKTVVVVFSTPTVDQDQLLGDYNSGYMLGDPLSNINVVKWGYDDIRNRRGYYTPIAYQHD